MRPPRRRCSFCKRLRVVRPWYILDAYVGAGCQGCHDKQAARGKKLFKEIVREARAEMQAENKKK